MDNSRVSLDASAIEKAVNDASSRAAALWLSFLSFAVYLCAAVGSVTHRMLFLEAPIKLPLFNLDLPLVGFFVIAPALFVTLHFYLFVQLELVAAKAAAYNATVDMTFAAKSDRLLMRQRLDSFPVLQLLAGPAFDRDTLLRVILSTITVLTLLVFPIILLLQIQLSFLAYHLEWVTWFHRILLFVDVAIVWMTWRMVDSGLRNRRPTTASSRPTWTVLATVLTPSSLAVVTFFSTVIATYPGEWIHENRLANLVDQLVRFRVESQSVAATEYLFRGPVDEVSGRPQSMFSNVLVLAGEKFVEDEKLEKVDRTLSLRGRDLRGAVFVRADLRKADLSGANLNEANLFRARLQGAWLQCIAPSTMATRQTRVIKITMPVSSPWPDGCTWLQGASLQEAELQGTSLDGARLEGASLLQTKLQGASLTGARLQGASLVAAEAQGAYFVSANLQGALLSGAKLQGAVFSSADVTAAHFGFQMLTAGTTTCPKHCTSLLFPKVSVWRMLGAPSSVHLTTLDMIDSTSRPFDSDDDYEGWRELHVSAVPDLQDRSIAFERLSVLDPKQPEPAGALDEAAWRKNEDTSPYGEAYEKALAEFLSELVCDISHAPFAFRGLVRNEVLGATGEFFGDVVARLRDVANCEGASLLTSKDMARLSDLERAVQEEVQRPPGQTFAVTLRRSAARHLESIKAEPPHTTDDKAEQ